MHDYRVVPSHLGSRAPGYSLYIRKRSSRVRRLSEAPHELRSGVLDRLLPGFHLIFRSHRSHGSHSTLVQAQESLSEYVKNPGSIERCYRLSLPSPSHPHRIIGASQRLGVDQHLDMSSQSRLNGNSLQLQAKYLRLSVSLWSGSGRRRENGRLEPLGEGLYIYPHKMMETIWLLIRQFKGQTILMARLSHDHPLFTILLNHAKRRSFSYTPSPSSGCRGSGSAMISKASYPETRGFSKRGVGRLFRY